jgi:hypothetical protein
MREANFRGKDFVFTAPLAPRNIACAGGDA